MKQITGMLFLIFFWLQYSFWFGKNGVCDFFHIKRNIDIKELNALRIKLKFCNNQLIDDINDLINNQKEAIEERARNDLGMIKSDEIFYHFIVSDRKNIIE